MSASAFLFLGEEKQMRNLQTHDVFMALKIANSTGLKEEFKRIAINVSNNANADEKEIGLDLIFTLLGRCADDKTEKLIYEFLGGILEIDPNEIKTMNPLELIEKIKELNTVIPVEEWKSFFQSFLQVALK